MRVQKSVSLELETLRDIEEYMKEHNLNFSNAVNQMMQERKRCKKKSNSESEE